MKIIQVKYIIFYFLRKIKKTKKIDNLDYRIECNDLYRKMTVNSLRHGRKDEHYFSIDLRCGFITESAYTDK